MDDAELRQQLRTILDLEAADPVNWPLVQKLSADLRQRISQSSEYEPPHLIYHYLDDVDIREKDGEYAGNQRADIERFVETGDRAGVESTPVSKWSCLLVLGLLVAGGIWLVV